VLTLSASSPTTVIMSLVRSILLALALVAPIAAQEVPSRGAGAYKAHCGSCHGADLKGSSTTPSILGYVQYHTDTEATERIRSGKGHRDVHLTDLELRQVLADLRILAGTNRDMATGGVHGGAEVCLGQVGTPGTGAREQHSAPAGRLRQRRFSQSLQRLSHSADCN